MAASAMFQSSPRIAAGRYGDISRRHRSWSICFNPRPASLRGATYESTEYSTGRTVFQSSPLIAEGRYVAWIDSHSSHRVSILAPHR